MKNEAALAALSDIVEPIINIAKDDKVKSAAKSKNVVQVVKLLTKDHAKEILEILAIMDGEDPATYEVRFFELPQKIMDFVNTPEIQSLFFSQDSPEENK